MRRCLNRKAERRTNFELMRVFSMLMIVTSHFCYHGIKGHPEAFSFSMKTIVGGVNYFTMEPLYILSCVAVNTYVMITGYFLIKIYALRWGGVLKILLQTLFYSIIILLVDMVVEKKEISPMDVLKSVFFIHGGIYWFVKVYLALLLIAPFLSRLVLSLDKRQYRFMLTVWFALSFRYLWGGVYGGFDTILWFSFLYLFAGYVRMYGINFYVQKYAFLICLLLLVVITTATIVINMIKGNHEWKLISTTYDGWVFFLSVSIFMYFANLKEKGNSKFHLIAKLAPYTFGVYLIHDHFISRQWLWHWLMYSPFTDIAILYCAVCVIAIFMVCVIIDILRERLFMLLKISKGIKYISEKLPVL